MATKPAPRAAAIGTSLRLYHGDAVRLDRMAAFYRAFVPEGGLAFDVGAHVGDRARVFRRLGARVVGVEPQPDVRRALRLVVRLVMAGDPGVVLEGAALGRGEGRMLLRINATNPTVSTLSDAFVAAAQGAEGWLGQVWSDDVEVPVTTLDALIARHGVPDFIKIDVEGFEDVVLSGLSHPVAALSFEVTTIHRGPGLRALEQLEGLGDYRFALSLGESFALDTGWERASDMRARLEALPHAANSGDVYARLQS
ncbi:MAG: FkbM family methyltransferase [Pseudomonadota bacterium]